MSILRSRHSRSTDSGRSEFFIRGPGFRVGRMYGCVRPMAGVHVVGQTASPFVVGSRPLVGIEQPLWRLEMRRFAKVVTGGDSCLCGEPVAVNPTATRVSD